MRLALCALLLLCTARAQSIPLPGFAWPNWRPDPYSTPKLWPPEDSTTVQFLSETELFVTYPTLNKKPGLSERSNPNGGVYVVNAATIDVASGEIRKLETLGNLSAFRRMRRVWGGLLFRRDMDQVFFRDAKGVDHKISSHARQLTASPQGMVALDERTSEDPQSVISFYSLLSLSKAGEVKVTPPYSWFDYMGDRIAVTMPMDEHESVVRVQETSPHQFKRPRGCDQPQFLDAKRLIFLCNEIVITDLDGHLLQHKGLGSTDTAFVTTRSAGGRFAGVVAEWQAAFVRFGERPGIDKLHIRLWQSDPLTELFSVKVPTRGPAAFDLSPSGERLVYIDEKGTVRVVEVPSKPKH